MVKLVKFEFKFKTYEDFLLNAIKLEEENKQMAKLTGYYAVAVIIGMKITESPWCLWAFLLPLSMS